MNIILTLSDLYKPHSTQNLYEQNQSIIQTKSNNEMNSNEMNSNEMNSNEMNSNEMNSISDNSVQHERHMFEHYIKLLDTKCNNMMKGEFTKVMYSDDFVTLNGIYLFCPLFLLPTFQEYSIRRLTTETATYSFNPNKPPIILSSKNHNLISEKYNGAKSGNYILSENSQVVTSAIELKVDSISLDNEVDMYRRTERIKNIISFQPNYPSNIPVIHQFSLFEKHLLDYYKQYTFCTKKPVYLLQTQLLSGSSKFYRDLNENTLNRHSPNEVHYIIKISGIWESDTTIGITYKFLEMYTK